MAVIIAAAALVGLVLSVALTAAALGYARRHDLLDQPGPRRSHVRPTPRGGGVGIVAAIVAAGLPAWYWQDGASAWPCIAAIAAGVLAVAAIGWRDDHVAMPVAPRLAVHGGAALVVGAGVIASAAPEGQHAWWVLIPLVVVLAGFINAHNFMDGIDGILGLQGVFVMAGFALLAGSAGLAGTAALAAATAAGCLGFLPYNMPPARIFMGDVGSGALGLAIGATAAVLVAADRALIWPCLILPSAFLIDSGLTLVHRMLAGQRWYAPHRQHLYQWLVRVHWSHARTDAAYMIWNLVFVAPLAWAAVRWPGIGGWFALAAWCAGAIAWHIGKRACLALTRRRSIHEPA